jgi:uridine kinase
VSDVAPSTHVPAAPSRVSVPRSVTELDARDLRAELRFLRTSPLFWTGVALKLGCALLFGSHFATRWFAPFVYEFVHGHFANPWDAFLARGEPMAFPYGPGMLVVLSFAWVPALFTSFDPSSHFGLLLLRLPLLAADLTICLLLMRWLRIHARDVIVAYWLSPIVLYATYVHGQLDLVPTAMLCVALLLLFERRIMAGAVVFGVALATKGHLLIAAPFALVFLYRLRRPRLAWLTFATVAPLTALAVYAVPLTSSAFRAMVLGSAESQKLWSVAVPYGPSGLVLYVAPAAVAIAFLRFASYRKINRELTLMLLGALYVGLVALVPPQPGWFIWSLPFVAYLGARFARTGRFVVATLTSAYLLYFVVEDPVTFFEALDPVLGAGRGAAIAAGLVSATPGVFSPHGASIAWTALFAVTALTAFEMYRKGVRSNAIYGFRDETFMVGIGGDSGAGKHTLGEDLSAVMGPLFSTVNGDDDHKWERGHAMWSRFTHLDPRGNLLGAQLESLAALRRGGAVRKRHYDHDKGRFTAPLLLKATDFIAIIGLHPFYMASQRQLFHLKVFVAPEEALRREWKVARDVAKRGYTKEQVLSEIDRRDADSAKYVRPQMKYADVVLRNVASEDSGADAVRVSVELASGLDALMLFDALDLVSTLSVEWEPDEALSRDTLEVKGTIDASEVRRIALSLVPNLEDLVADVDEGWKGGARGLAQVVLLHAMSARLRAVAPSLEAA